MPLDVKALVAQADHALSEYSRLRQRSAYDDCSDQHEFDIARVLNVVAATIERLAPRGTHYPSAANALLRQYGPGSVFALKSMPGILQSLRDDLAAGRMQSVSEMIHGDLFGDMLEGATHLREEGWKDPAAVVAGSVLEQHLRELCAKHTILVEKADGTPKKADTLNSELASAGAYSKLDLKSVTAWLDLRNKAAHGKYAEYETQQVATMIDGIRDFVRRCPA